jgi:FKBP-type peptidyl-prolyl cis-trans isomerase
MPKRGIKILEDVPGSGPILKTGDRVRLQYSVQLNRGDILARDDEAVFTIGDRNEVAGFRYGLEGMRVGGSRRFKASPHLCYRDEELERIPKNAVLVFDIKHVELTAQQ